MTCFDCKRDISGRVVWLGEDHGDKGRVVYPFHEDCSLGPWPLFELTEQQAKEWIADGAHTTGADGSWTQPA
jgi:hypothetical protein